MFKGTLLPDKWGHQAAGHEAKSGGAGAAATALRLAWLAAVRRPLPLIAHMHAEALATHPPTPLRHHRWPESVLCALQTLPSASFQVRFESQLIQRVVGSSKRALRKPQVGGGAAR